MLITLIVFGCIFFIVICAIANWDAEKSKADAIRYKKIAEKAIEELRSQKARNKRMVKMYNSLCRRYKARIGESPEPLSDDNNKE